ncbi:MAG: RNA polymerase factor sigma-32 [Lactobacillaceae bacterium]|jgi:RNA polymerase sigma-32 factor|nr:RNA polymerase factor sigma-32 [Lactobacillaceae bacterium]
MKYINALSNTDFSPELNLSRYLQTVARFPMLSQEEELYLTTAYKKTKGQNVACKIITSHLKLVVKIVSQYKGYKLSLSEMISEGNLGLLNALEKFDPEKGYRFSTYAMWWIRAYVQKYILNSWSLVKIGTTSAQKKLFFNLRKIKNHLELMDDRQLSDNIIEKIATSLDVSSQEVREMNQRMSGRDGSLNVAIDASEESGTELIDFLSDKRPNQEEVLEKAQITNKRRGLFNEAVKILNPREKDILFKRRMLDKALTLDEISKMYNISKERVRQIELGSIKKIQKVVASAQ